MHRRGFSLASLLLLTAVVAVFLAAISTLWLATPEGQDAPHWDVTSEADQALIVIGALAGLLIGPCVGLVIGANQARPLWGVFLGTSVGLVAGAACGVLVAVPGKTLPVVVGSLVIVLFGAAVRQWSGRPPR